MQETWVRSMGREDPPGEGNGNPLQYSCLENPMGRGAWWATVYGVAKSWMWLHFHFHFQNTGWELDRSFPSGSDSEKSSCNAGDPGLTPGSGRSPGERNGNPLQHSCLGNPMDRGAWQATVYGFARIRHDLATKPPPSSSTQSSRECWNQTLTVSYLKTPLHKSRGHSSVKFVFFWILYIRRVQKKICQAESMRS